MSATKIEWADKVWNPITGCTPISAGCQHCYARKMARRLAGRYGYPADDPFRVTWRVGARVMDPAWAIELYRDCKSAGVPFFFKQWGGVRKKKAGRTLDGRTWDEMPVTQTRIAA